MARRHFSLFDDPFNSPITSPTLLTGNALLNSVPGSALAERIFNDPEAWEVVDEGYPDGYGPYDGIQKEEMTWLENEIKRFSMTLTPSMFSSIESALLDEDITSPPSPTYPKNVRVTSKCDELAAPRPVSQEKFRANPKPDPITVFPTYVHDPPGGLNAPRLDFIGGLPGFESDDMIHLFSPSNFRGDLHGRLILGGTDDVCRSSMEQMPQSSHILSPSSSEGSSAGSRSGYDTSSTEHPNSLVPMTLAFPVPSSPATSITSPFKVHSASATLSFLEWHGIEASTPLGSASVPEAVQMLASGLTPPSSPIVQFQQLSRISGPQAVNPCTSEDENLDIQHDIQPDVSPHSTNSREVSSEASSSSLDQSPLPQTPHFLINAKRQGMICETPTKRRPSTPFLYRHASPMPPPTIPLPDIPFNPPLVHPKAIQPLPSSDKNRSHNSVRRLPTVRMNSARDSDVNAATSPMVYTPLPQPPHTSIHHTMKSNSIPKYSTPPSSWPRFEYSGSSPHTRSYSASQGSIVKSPSCPTGPRRRGGDTVTPTHSDRYAHALGNGSTMSVVGMVVESSPVVTVWRTVSAPRGLPRHAHSKSE